MLIMIFFLLKSNIKHVRNERKVIFYNIISVIFLCFVPEFLPITMFALSSGTFHITVSTLLKVCV